MGALADVGPEGQPQRHTCTYGGVEIEVDEQTRELLDAVLKPIESRLNEMRDEQRYQRDRIEQLKTKVALADRRFVELEAKLNERNKVFTPMFAALATVYSVLFGVFVWWITN